MRIAQVSDFYLPRLGGIEMHVADLADRQRAGGHVVEVMTSTPGPESAQIVRLTSGLRHPHPVHPLAVAAGIRSIAAGGYDVVHAHLGVGSPLAFFVARAAARSGIPTVVTVHSLWAGVRPLMTSLDAVGGWSRSPIVWTAVSEAAAAPVRRILGPDHPVSIIPNGIAQGQWRLPAAPREPHLLVLAAVMRLAARKRPMALLNIVREAQIRLGTEVRLRLVIAGEGPRRTAMERYLRRHDMSSDVFLHGRLGRHEIRRMLATAHLFLAPADLESFGIAALEARCAGLPVVAKSSGGIGEFVAHEREGLLCSSDRRMVDAVVRLARDEVLRSRIARHNRTSTCPVAWSQVLKLTDSAYRQAVRVQLGSDGPLVPRSGPTRRSGEDDQDLVAARR